jgi:hypothetical protein
LTCLKISFHSLLSLHFSPQFLTPLLLLLILFLQPALQSFEYFDLLQDFVKLSSIFTLLSPISHFLSSSSSRFYSSSSSTAATKFCGFWLALSFRSTVFYLYISVFNFPLLFFFFFSFFFINRLYNAL